MKVEEYKLKLKENEDWAPGWDAIDKELNRVFNNVEPIHFGTDIHKRAVFGGDQFLDGYSVYTSEDRYKHIITYGYSDLYASLQSFGKNKSGWGYEMTMKLKAETEESCFWVLNMLSNIAYFTFTNEVPIKPISFMGGKGTSLNEGTPSKITALIFINDTELNTIDTIHGKVEFIQLFGILQEELIALRNGTITIENLIANVRQANPKFITDMDRVETYL